MRLFPDKVARGVADLFDSDPDGWTANHFEARHKGRDVTVWVANDAYGLDVRIGGVSIDYGVNIFWHGSQRHIWRAFKRWRSRRAVAALSTAAQSLERAAA